MSRRRRSKRAAAASAEKKIRNVFQDINKTAEEEDLERRKDSKPSAKKNRSESVVEDLKWRQIESMRESSPVVPPSNPRDQRNENSSSGSIHHNDSDSSSSEEKREKTLVHKMEHGRRRALRDVNSDGPMRLSRQTSFRMSRGACTTPMYSPIVATALHFTPDATQPPAS